jgi:CheY-like chemotaxis protein
MEGSITVESVPGQGSCFEIRLPYLPIADELPAWAPPSADHEEARPLAGKRVLVAEDVEINQEIAQSVLDDFGAQVTLAANGLQALERIRQHGATAFDIVLMDIQMPVMNGYEATRQIHPWRRSCPSSARLPMPSPKSGQRAWKPAWSITSPSRSIRIRCSP